MDKIKDDAGRGTATNGNMKQALVIAVALWTVSVSGVSAVELPPELKEIVDAAHENCLAQSGVDEGKSAHGTNISFPLLPENPEINFN